MTKKEYKTSDFARFLNCGPTVLAVAQYHGPPNIITLAWLTPVSHEPPLVVIAVAPRRYSHALISQGREVTINIPPWERLEETYFCGHVSGRDADKFAECALTPLPSRNVKPPGVAECLATLECAVEDERVMGDHTVFVLRVLRIVADEEAVAGRFGLGEGEPTTIHHLGGRVFAPLGGPAQEAGRRK